MLKKKDLKNNLKLILTITISLLLFFQSVAFADALTATHNLDYDANGNLVDDISNYYEYNSLNQLIRVRENDQNGRIIEEYFYDENDQRIKKITYFSDATSKITYYLGDMVREVDDSGTRDTVFYYDSANLVARKDSDGSLYFYHPNHLGSTDIVTDLNGNVVEETKYLPFGELLQGGDSRYLFTGQEKDKETGLSYYNARYYSSFLRHFTQPDTILPNIYDPQQLNRYSYVRNNPVKYVDSSGNWVQIALGVAIGAVIGAGVNMVSQIMDGASMFDGTMNWKEVGKSAIVGGVAGGVAGLTMGTGNAMIGSIGLTGKAAVAAEGTVAATSSVASGQASRAAFNVIEGNEITAGLGNIKDMGIDAGIGVITYGFGKAWETSYIKKSWSKQSFETVDKSINYHYDKHITQNIGKTGRGYMSPLEYTQRSQKLYQNYIKNNLDQNAKVNLVTLSDKSQGIRINSGKEFGIYASEGKTVSYHPPSLEK